MSVLAAIAVLAILIVVHELGHFGAARLQGIRVNKFSIGFGPVLAKYDGKETEYALRAFPLGGYVGFPDDDPESDIPLDDPDLLRNRPIFDRAIVISAGVIANLIFAYFLLVGQSITVGVQDVNFQPGVLIPEILNEGESPAQKAGLESGDVILKIENLTLPSSEEAIAILRDRIQESPNQSLQFTIQRNQETFDVPIIPELGDNGKGKIGVMLAPNGEFTRRKPDNIIEAFTFGAKQFERYTKLTVQGFGQLITNFQENANQVAGPVAIVAVGAQLAKSDLGNLFQFGALISINLAVINILPLPALDGGQLAFLAVEGILGKPLPNRLQEGIMQTGLVLLLGLGIFLILRDTLNLAFLN
ncbi:RIP metalloprotease RseP [Cyanobacterium stanieri LEGE 03274]|uniref:Zinc metalloprotease n=1 Tax=Cyanobacterium stanieri LEGE 03274 TaxID=1828756 RepID=A0ABR9V5L2_9CHRO|nr:RIP metalloprotease RseP [Cyanobacterium stanieri]MBE9223181.1 RIP metalloprotease RseP [Cyanobacterium stanieri LEGE 03274]